MSKTTTFVNHNIRNNIKCKYTRILECLTYVDKKCWYHAIITQHTAAIIHINTSNFIILNHSQTLSGVCYTTQYTISVGENIQFKKKMADKKNLLLLLDRPQEPVFMEKGGAASSSVFDVPDNYLTDRYRPIGTELTSRFGETANQRIPVRNISLPDLRIPMSLARDEKFSLFIPRHRRIAGRLIDIFIGKT